MAELGAQEGLRLAGEAARLDSSTVRHLLEAPRAHTESEAHDVGDYDFSELRELLRHIGPPADDKVDVVWGDAGIGVRMDWEAVVDSIDDLWAPSSTDLVIGTRDGFIHIDHEEVVRIYRS